MEMSNAENFLAGFCDVVNPIKKPSAVYAHPAEKLQNTLVFNLSIRDRLDRKPGCKTDGLVMGNPVAKLIDMVQLIENVLVVNAEYRSGFGLGWKNGQQFQKFAIFGVFIPGNLWRNPSYRVSHFLCKDSTISR